MALFDVLQNLRWWLMLFSLLVFATVFTVMFVSIWHHHRSGVGAAGNFHASVAVELCWALAPVLIVVVLVWPAARAWISH